MVIFKHKIFNNLIELWYSCRESIKSPFHLKSRCVNINIGMNGIIEAKCIIEDPLENSKNSPSWKSHKDKKVASNECQNKIKQINKDSMQLHKSKKKHAFICW